ncbi:unnamed protein product [Adineta ricciae]|uniref:MACPF domain-containing protein n=1 Tax=Adineta ricciae TaxID=249248 RepID=A0A816DFI8_ADIRI|nr:unnamed protein product [Adineta ricciae]
MQYLILFIMSIICAQCNMLDVYPGYGWDDLRHVDMSSVFNVLNFENTHLNEKCIQVYPVREQKMELVSSIIDVFDSYETDYSSDLFVGGSASYMGFKVSGSYSQNYQSSKKLQREENTIILRNHIDFIMSEVLMSPSCELHAEAKKRLVDIAKYETNNQSAMATYAAQLFVKEYGTHYTNRLRLGGSIAQDDHIQRSTFKTNDSSSKSYQAAAEASFHFTFSLSAKFASSSRTDDSSVHEARKEFTRKVVHSRGGRVSVLNSSIETWQASIEEAPVIVQRGIENLTYIVQPYLLPELSNKELVLVREKLNTAIETFIQMNLHYGCMNRNSPSFNWIANVNDSSCELPKENWQLGGFIQTCIEDHRLNPKCQNFKMLNYYTETDQCPVGFIRHHLHKKIQKENTCCTSYFEGIGTRTIDLYDCVSESKQFRSKIGSLKVANNYVFGGFFTPNKLNPITGVSKCPNEVFSQVSVKNSDISICISKQVSNIDNLPHYGGMYSCQKGNAMNSNKKQCPISYSSHVISALDGDCLLYICLKFDEIPEVKRLPSIILPPFFTIPLFNETSMDVYTVNLTDIDPNTTAIGTSSKSNGITYEVSIAVGCIGSIVLILVILFTIKKKQQCKAKDTKKIYDKI